MQADCRLCGADHADPATRHWLACHAAPNTSWRDSGWLARLMPSGWLDFAAAMPANGRRPRMLTKQCGRRGLHTYML
ncbi:hypothetical protein CBM2589_P160007 [Cupriavidus taiwanensis]|uniref:Uncharacterized protein n=2 Tax=Cupriavidus TaxID=106589 RepID=A0A375CLN4_9BURK|nr:hypothetical protein A9P79_29950 [Cupriavidus taiwanensis]SOZ40444.1 hypothetical protein CBM2605_P160008 [Cupriavidus neocaledonicus]SOY75445.1 hypothetical protein CBM2589_P160007 [Cupriavidus taiwanensis]SOZ01750.1 hypothetical protein CBM2600_P160008 [Cupriavidus taiwanensis]SOZ16286.1 hypothetical protein CBM2597_P110013 [Cupriavidus taiwanensis]